MILDKKGRQAAHYFKILISRLVARWFLKAPLSWFVQRYKTAALILQSSLWSGCRDSLLSLQAKTYFPCSPLCQPAIFASFNFFKFRQDSSEQPDRKIEIHFLKRTKPMRHKRKEPLVADSTCSTLGPLPCAPPALVLTLEKSVSATFTINTVFSSKKSQMSQRVRSLYKKQN